MSTLPITNIINVTVTDTPSGITEKNVNSLALFTDGDPGDNEPFGIYISAAQVATDYGTSSIEAEMANAIFSQSPNILSGKGRLVIVPMIAAVSATAGGTYSADISGNLATLITINDGDLKVTINGTVHDLTGVDFTNCTTLAHIAAVLQSLLVDVTVTATSTVLTFESKKVGATSAVVYAAVSGGAGTDLAAVGALDSVGSTPSSGADSTGETILEAITRTQDAVGYAGVITSLDLEDDAVEAIATGIQALDMMFVHHVASTQDIAGLGTTIKDATETKTRIVLHTDSMAEANLMKAAYAGRAFSTNFNGSNTSQTLNLKALATITPDTGITQTLYAAANVAGVDLYISYDGVPSIYSTGGNDFFDNPYTNLALKFALQTAGFNFLRQTNTKVPQTEAGMNGLKDAYEQIMERFVFNGCVAPGTWTSSETFGDPEIMKNNILNRGYYIYSLSIVDQSAAERALREAPLVQMAVKRSGAIHTSDVLVVVNA